MIKPKGRSGGPQRDCGGRLPPFLRRGPRTQRAQRATSHREAACLAGKKSTRGPPRPSPTKAPAGSIAPREGEREGPDLPSVRRTGRRVDASFGEGRGPTQPPEGGEGLRDHLRFHIYSPALVPRPQMAHTLPGPGAIRGGAVLYGVVRAWVGFPIQSGPPRFAPKSGCKGPWLIRCHHGPRERPGSRGGLPPSLPRRSPVQGRAPPRHARSLSPSAPRAVARPRMAAP